MTPVTVRLPPALCELLACDRRIEVHGQTVGDALNDLVKKEPGLGLHLFDETGALRRLVLCFCNQENIRDREGLDQSLASGDEITIINSVAGG
jgi:adenylyltransferase/sulfurtransferase